MECCVPDSPLSSSIEKAKRTFSEAFRSILDSITPSILTGFDSSTVQLLLEVCYSYLTDKDIQHQ